MVKKIVMIAVIFGMIAMLIIPQGTMADASLSYTCADDPATVGTDSSVSIRIHNTGADQIFVKAVVVQWDWRVLTYDRLYLDEGIPSGESISISVPYDVPENTELTLHAGIATVYYDEAELNPISTEYDDSVNIDLEVEVVEGANLWFYITLVVIVAVVIIVVSISVLYIKKKPQVHIHNKVTQVPQEKEDPKTRIRAPAQRAASSNATQVVGTGGSAATVVTTPGGGMEVMFPKGTKKMVTNEMIIGRQDFSHVIDDSLLPRISKNHLRIYKEGNSYMVEDGYRGKASTNGTKLNGREIRGAGPQPITMPSTLSISDVVDLQLTPNK